MSGRGLDALTKQLRDQPPAGVAGLPDEHLTHLSTALHSARVRQAQQLQTASDRALDSIPRLFRGPVKKIVG